LYACTASQVQWYCKLVWSWSILQPARMGDVRLQSRTPGMGGRDSGHWVRVHLAASVVSQAKV
jgi:hypothetical protein